MAISVVGVIAIVCALLCFFVRRRKKTGEVLGKSLLPFSVANSARNEHTMKPLSISFQTLKTATSNFSVENKLGEGGFGPVYKVRLVPGTFSLKLCRATSRMISLS